MRNLVVKTVGLTLAGILLITGITLTFISFFSPVTLARLTESIGLKEVSVSYYERQYNKTHDLNDLANLIFRLDADTDAKTCETYCLSFFKNPNYADYLKGKGAERFKSEIKAGEYFYGKFCIVEYNLDKINNSVKIAKKHIEDYNSYAKYGEEKFDNPLTTLISAKGVKLTATDLDYLELELNAIKENPLVQDADSQTKITNDINRVIELKG